MLGPSQPGHGAVADQPGGPEGVDLGRNRCPARGRIPELRLDGLDACALGDEQTRAGLPKVVEPQPLWQRSRALILGQPDHRLVGGTDSWPKVEV